MFLTDIDNNNVRKIAPDGTITTVAGNGTIGYSGDGGIATGAQLSSPGDVAVDSSGNIIISDTYNNVIRKINASTGIINTIAGNGTAGYFGDNGPALNSKLNFPYGVYVDKQDNIFIAERLNGVIRKIDGSTGIITTAVGCGIEGFSGDGGPTTDAKLRPDDVFFDENGTMYIADYGNNRIRAVYNSKLGVTNIKLTNDVLIYPNPAQNEVIIENAEGSGVKIYNLLGQEELNAKNISNKEVVNIQGLIPGIYVVQIIGANGEVQNKRVIKE